jgi:GT2 family glycosyltransferase
MDKYNILVLIASHNRPISLLKCLASLKKSLTNHSYTVSLANSGESVEFPEALSSNLIETKVPSDFYWAEAMYEASRIWSELPEFSHVLWLNDDVELFPDAVSDFLLVLSDSSADVLVGQTVAKSGELSYGGFRIRSKLLPLHFVRLHAHETLVEADTFNGNVVLLGPNALAELGPFADGYKHYLADMAYGLEANRRGLNVFLAPGFAGWCEPNLVVNPALDNMKTRRSRLDILNKPPGLPVKQQWRFSLRFGGVLGVGYFLTTYLRFCLALVSYNTGRIAKTNS